MSSPDPATTEWVPIWSPTGGGIGDVRGPTSATTDAIALYDGTTGKLIKNSLAQVSAAGDLSVRDVYEKARTVPMGHWISVAFNAANFSGNGAMTWTLQAGDQLAYSYTLVGKTMFISGYFNQTTVGGTVNTDLRVAIPGGFVANGLVIGLARVNPAAGAFSPGTVYVLSGGTLINFQTINGTNWVAGADITALQFSLAFPIQ